jgi:hypothetical protein
MQRKGEVVELGWWPLLGRLLMQRTWIAGLLTLVCVRGVACAATIGAATQVGTITSSTLDEISGLVASRSNAGALWVHNDSNDGDTARFFAMSTSGARLGTFTLTGATNFDWEDIAIGPKLGGGNYLYLGDIGDNNALRSTITVYRTTEPLSTGGATIASIAYTSVKLKYPGGARDAESMFVDPLSGDLFIISKRTELPELYSVPANVFDTNGQTVTMTALGSFASLPDMPTAADISPDGRYILVRSSKSSTGLVYERGIGQSVASAFEQLGTAFTLGPELQGEAIGWAPDGKSFFTTSEIVGGTPAPVHSYSFAAPLSVLPGDYNNDHVVDAADYSVWRDQFGAEIALPNEVETPGSVTSEDYVVWKGHFGETLPGGDELSDARSVVVPEPASAALVMIVVCACGAFRQRRS